MSLELIAAPRAAPAQLFVGRGDKHVIIIFLFVLFALVTFLSFEVHSRHKVIIKDSTTLK